MAAFETLTVPGADAVSTCLRLREEGRGRFTPVLLGDPEEADCLIGRADGGASPEKHIALSREIDVKTYIRELVSEDEEYYGGVEVGQWPEEAHPHSRFVGVEGYVRGHPLNTVLICKVPTPRSWEVPAYLWEGGWNDCPQSKVHIAFHKYWSEKYGAELITVTRDVLECTVARPPRSEGQAMELAWEQFVYCSDIVYQGTQTISALAAALLEESVWFFWWD